MTDAPIVSCSRNGEDVVLLRALGDVADGRFLEFRDPADTDGPPALQALLDRGWIGAVGTVADLADPSFVDALLATTLGTRELNVVMVATDLPPDDPAPILELARQGPWVLVVGVHPAHDRGPLTSALDSAGYRCCLYDGMSAYFVADGHAADLRDALSYPAGARDHYLPRAAARLLDRARQREALALESALRWREKAVQSWADHSMIGQADREELIELREHADRLAREIAMLHRTLSWRVTAPLRNVRRLRRAPR